MGISYRAVGWNRQKKRYDLVAGGILLAYLVVFVVGGVVLHPSAAIEALLIRALGTSAFALLHVILLIGPLSRFSERFLPLLYNRRHLGVMLIVLAAAHVAIVTIQYHAFGPLNPLVSILTDGGKAVAAPSFQVLGLIAFVILLLMAATSHDFWLHNLTAPVWKALHMGVYLAYLLLVGHVSFGILHQEHSIVWLIPVLLGTVLVGSAHVAAALRERAADRRSVGIAAGEGFMDVCHLDALSEEKGQTFAIGEDRVAVFRYSGKVSAVANACRHQNGPLGEGRIINGCIVCPWHGYEYDPATGKSPPPFTEKVCTYRVRIRQGRVLIHPEGLPPGTPVEPARIKS